MWQSSFLSVNSCYHIQFILIPRYPLPHSSQKFPPLLFLLIRGIAQASLLAGIVSVAAAGIIAGIIRQ